MKGGIPLVNVVLDPVEKIFLWSLPNCATGSAFFCQARRSIKQPDGGLAVTGDDDFHECSKRLSLSVAGQQFWSPDSSTNHPCAETLVHLARRRCLLLALAGSRTMSELSPLYGNFGRIGVKQTSQKATPCPARDPSRHFSPDRLLWCTVGGSPSVATASLLENWIDEAERRSWFLFESIRK
jgi:hypothetical protein